MKKKIVRSILLISSTLALASCGSENKPNAVNPFKDHANTVVEGTLHDINFSYEEGVPFVTDGNSDYKIYFIKNGYAQTAASYIFNQIYNATGAMLETIEITDETIISSDQHAIVIGSLSSMESEGINIYYEEGEETDPRKGIGYSGYQITTKGSAAYLYARGEDGFQLSCLKFLELTMGYDLLYGKTIIFERDGSILPKMDVVERPDFDYRQCLIRDSSFKYGAGYTNNTVFCSVGESGKTNQYHTSFHVLQPGIYYNDHPDWFYCNGGPENLYTLNNGSAVTDKIYGSNQTSKYGQLCYTAHGNEAERKLMIEQAADNLYRFITSNGNEDLTNVTFTIEDNNEACNCDKCLEVKAHYNGSIAATIVLFMNEVDDIIQARLKEDAETNNKPMREMNICFFAYHAYQASPTRINASTGEYELVDGIKANPHVCAFFAPIHASYVIPLYDTSYPDNEDAVHAMKGWSKVCDKIYCWLYETNFHHYFYPYNTFTSMIETFRFVKQNNCSMVFPQDQHDAGNWAVFNKLKFYIDSKALINVNVNAQELINKFFKYFYGEGGDIMYQFFLEMNQWYDYIRQAFPNDVTGYINNELDKPYLWNAQSLKRWRDMCYECLEKSKHFEDETPAKYAQIEEACVIESIFPRWALLNLFSSSFSPDVLKEEQKSFKNDCDRFNLTQFGETNSRDLGKVFESWGL